MTARRRAAGARDAGPRSAPNTELAAQHGRYGGEFDAAMSRYPGVGGWHFVTVPEQLAPRATHAWGRTPVVATVDGHTWHTSVWRGKDGQTMLAIPKAVRQGKGDGDLVHVAVRFDAL